MKYIFFLVPVLVLALSSCGSKKDTTSSEEFVVNDGSATASDPIAEGEKLVAGSDCKTCHHSVNKLIGPAHTEVAKKYEFTAANVSMLAQKIIQGGQGVWGQIPMTAHPDITVADAEKMARYVLSLDGEKEH
ncbi:MAG: cytochrome C552 [Bacteroidetes bacterium]|nr:cytochrome C552 [Bacteroidota bacterium]